MREQKRFLLIGALLDKYLCRRNVVGWWRVATILVRFAFVLVMAIGIEPFAKWAALGIARNVTTGVSYL